MYKVGDDVQVFSRWRAQRHAIGQVEAVDETGVGVVWLEKVPTLTPDGMRDVLTGIHERFGPKGGGNAEWRIESYTDAERRADEEATRLRAVKTGIKDCLRAIESKLDGYSEKELRAISAAVKVFGRGKP